MIDSRNMLRNHFVPAEFDASFARKLLEQIREVDFAPRAAEFFQQMAGRFCGVFRDWNRKVAGTTKDDDERVCAELVTSLIDWMEPVVASKNLLAAIGLGILIGWAQQATSFQLVRDDVKSERVRKHNKNKADEPKQLNSRTKEVTCYRLWEKYTPAQIDELGKKAVYKKIAEEAVKLIGGPISPRSVPRYIAAQLAKSRNSAQG